MKNIQITMGAVETLNERIHILQEELKELENQKTALVAQKGAKVAKKAFFSILGTVLVIMAIICFTLTCVAASDDEGAVAGTFVAFMVIFILFAIACFNSDSSEEESDRVVQLERSIASKQVELDEYKKKKKELILENERKLSDSLEEKITEDFSFDDAVETKECPMCAETVKAKARICRYCGYKFE